ncbi:Uncharacterized protein FWK35_00015844, partial [Aphis craccivora]
HGGRSFARFSESQAKVYVSSGANESQTVERVVSSALANHEPRWTSQDERTSACGSGDYTTPPPINTSAERKIGQYSVLPYPRPTQGRLAQFGRFCQHILTAARPTKGRLAQFCYTVKPTKTSTKRIPQVNKIQSTVKAHYKTAVLASYENSSLSIRLVRTTEIDDIKTEKNRGEIPKL